MQPYIESTSITPMLTFALHDLGIMQVARLAVAAQLESGELKSVLEEFIPQDVWLHAAYAQRRHNNAALTALLDFLEKGMPKQAAAGLTFPLPRSENPCEIPVFSQTTRCRCVPRPSIVNSMTSPRRR
ncbi:LysR substrate-binding domain-containing protein [Ottowia sp. VDI28]|uniref:LysR substrate-binding domain-containing protein n=1 Tax=Ottowia sp. VDI28 TaxID=3133968 RepID=UPI003C2B767C